MTGPVVEARHADAVDALCLMLGGWLTSWVGRPIPDDVQDFNLGVFASIGLLALDPVPGSWTNQRALTEHGSAVINAWLDRQAGVS